MTDPENGLAARLRQLIYDELRLPNPNAFAADVSLPHQTISILVNGKGKPSAPTLEAIATRYPHLSLTWLLTGAGEPFPLGVHGEKAAAAATPDVAAALSEATIAKAEAQMYQQQLESQAAYIKALKKQLDDFRKSGGNLDQPRSNGRRPTGPTMGFRPNYMLSIKRRVNGGSERLTATR